MAYSLSIGFVAFLVALAAGRPLVELLRRRRLGKAISADGPATHAAKAGTPTMGGLLILAVGLGLTLAANLYDDPAVLLPFGVGLAAGLMGLADDLLTLQGYERVEAHARSVMLAKVGGLTAIGLAAGLILYYPLEIRGLNIPHFGDSQIGLWFVPLAVGIVVATTSAVAITDGLDGLAAGTTALAFGAYGVIAALQGQEFLATFSFTMVGATLGFLWYNAHPARVFMGDTGALALGASLSVVALMTGWWLLLPLIGVVFVAEALSDVIQVGYFRLTGGRRVFRMSPLHHHFELVGWSEPQVVLRFWLAGMMGAMLGIALALTD
jgi:phospho-N-acetylmuramoyl-pentapeptide-transferase